MNVVLPPSNISSGVDVEERSFTWTIGNFPVLRKHKHMIDSQTFPFIAGETTGHPSQWTFKLLETPKDGRKWIGIFLELGSPRATDVNFNASYLKFRCTIKNKAGELITSRESELTHVATKFSEFSVRGFNEFIDPDDANQHPDQDLVIQIAFKLYTPSRLRLTTGSLEAITKTFQVTFLDQLRKDFAGLLETADACTDIKIISNDEKEFSMKKGILAARSEVFAAMLRADMTEANSGVINLPDISSRTLKVLLTFMFAGGLDPDWNHAEVLVELTNAAAKYQLPDLLQFLDATLGKVCKVENVLELFTLAQQLSLKTAEEELSKFISAHSISVERCCEMLKGVSFTGMNDPVHSLPKRKSRFWTLTINPFKALFAKN